jgi:hypothetical protein
MLTVTIYRQATLHCWNDVKATTSAVFTVIFPICFLCLWILVCANMNVIDKGVMVREGLFVSGTILTRIPQLR